MRGESCPLNGLGEWRFEGRYLVGLDSSIPSLWTVRGTIEELKYLRPTGRFVPIVS